MQRVKATIGVLLLLLSGAVNAALSRPILEEGKPTVIQALGVILDVVVTSHLSGTDRLSMARRIDRQARWFFPVLFGLAIYGSFMV